MEQIIVFQQQLPSKIVDIPVPRGAPLDFHQDPPRVAGSTGLPGTENQGFFRAFPRRKKCAVGFALESEGARQCQPIRAGCSAGGRALAGLHRVGAAQGTLWQDLLLDLTYLLFSLAGTGWCRRRVDWRKE